MSSDAGVPLVSTRSIAASLQPRLDGRSPVAGTLMMSLWEDVMNQLAQPFVANDLLNDATALRKRMNREGYLFFRSIFDPNAIRQIRLQVLEICREAGWLQDGAP